MKVACLMLDQVADAKLFVQSFPLGKIPPQEPTGFSAWTISMLTENPVVGYIVVLCCMSLVTFVAYGWDKRQAQNNGWRVSKKQLHTLALLGGWPGAMIGQNFFRHKTQQMEFKVMTWVAAALHVFLVGAYLYSLF